MKNFFIKLEKYLVNDREVHYKIGNIEEFKSFYKEISKEAKKTSFEIYAETKNKNGYKYKESVLVNNLKIVGIQLANAIGINYSIEKQVKSDNYEKGNGVKNIATIDFPNIKLIDINMLVDKEAEVIETEEEFNKLALIAEQIIIKNDGKVPHSIAALIRKEIITAYETDKEFRDIQWACKVNKSDWLYFKNWYGGGLCFTNSNWQGKEIWNICHADMTTAYISQMYYQQFPLCAPFKVNLWNLNRDQLIKILNNNFYLGFFKIENPRPKLSFINPLKYNKDTTELYLTNFDFKIVKDCYDYDNLTCWELWLFPNIGKLPNSVRKIMYNLFEDKKKLKELKYTEHFDETEYDIAKKKVNCSYGIFASGTDVKYNNIFWTIYTTAWQRYTLYHYIKTTGFNNFIYCDTDSIFAINQILVEEGNELGKWERDDYKRILVKGCKGYLLEDYNNKLTIILAGAAKPGVKEFIKDNHLSTEYLFENFNTLAIPAKYEVCYRYLVKDNEVYKYCYPIEKTVGDTKFNIYLDIAFGRTEEEIMNELK